MTNIIESGEIENQHENKNIHYAITLGLNSDYAADADVEWLTFNLAIMNKLRETSSSNEEYVQLLKKHQLEDVHWNWLTKSMLLSTEEYEWFYFIAEDKVQGICNIYHPKPSKIDKENIFYVEYLAVAPWNRDNIFGPQQFKGVGTALLKIALHYAIKQLGYRPGFSLHSLPQATAYYEKIGMKNFGPDKIKQNLHYLEMEHNGSERFANA